MLTAARSYDPERGEPTAWLLGITARLIANSRRRQGRESAATARIAGRRLIDESDIERLEERIDAARASRAVLDALDRLRPRAREALMLVGAEGLSPTEAARVLGISAAAFRMRAERCPPGAQQDGCRCGRRRPTAGVPRPVRQELQAGRGHHPVNTETPAAGRFEDRLLAAILADFDNLAGHPAPPASLARYRKARRPVTIRRAGPALIAGAAAVTVGVVGVSALSGHPQSRGTQAATRPLAHPRIQTAAYVVDHMRAAMNANTAVEAVLEHAPDSQTGKPTFEEIWSIHGGDTDRIANLSPSGKPIDAYIVTETAHRTVSIHVSYQHRTWSKTTYPFGSASSPRSPGPVSETPEQAAAALRAEVAAGKMTLVGRATVDGQKAIELRQDTAQGLLDMWVSPATCLPIRTIATAPGVSQASDQAIRDDSANLRLVTAADAIPAGFTQVGA